MSDMPQTQPPGWYYAQGDPPGTQRYWNGQTWEGGPQPVSGSPQAAMAGTGGLPLAEPLMRILARILDGLILLIPVIIVSIVLVIIGPDVLANLLVILLAAAYEIWFVGTKGATPGKMVLGLQVTRVGGSPVDMKDAVMRYAIFGGLGILGLIPILGILASIASLIVIVVSLVFLFTDAGRQTVWDKIATTQVVTTK